MNYFEVQARLSVPSFTYEVNYDGEIDYETEQVIEEVEPEKTYIVYEYHEDGTLFNIKEYKEDDFDTLKQEHQPPKWQNNKW